MLVVAPGTAARWPLRVPAKVATLGVTITLGVPWFTDAH
jgi:hypothetical protein